MNKRHLHILQHSLGLDDHGRTKQGRGRRYAGGDTYRNYFVTGEGTDNWPVCVELVSMGLLARHAPRDISGGDLIFTVTDAGKREVMAQSPEPPKVSAGRERYLEWLRVSDCFPGWSFGDWLKNRKRLRAALIEFEV